MVALLGFIGVIPMDHPASDSPKGDAQVAAGRTSVMAGDAAAGASGAADSTPDTSASRTKKDRTVSHALEQVAQPGTDTRASNVLPADSGTGRRVVFSKSAQRVWLVNKAGGVTATYLVSGSVTNNLNPGKYSVYSRSRWAVGVEDSGVMQYFVRFAHGPHAAIGFHSIPSKLGHPLQKISQLGTPQSHGCIRQKLSDAERMWGFAKTGTAVVVLA